MWTPEVVLSLFVILGAVVGVVSFHCTFLLAKSNRGVVSWIYPIVILIAIIMATKGVESIQGFPIEGRPEVKFEYIGHVDDGTAAIVTVRIQNKIKTHRWIPTQEEKEQMKQASDGTAKGLTYQMQMREGQEPNVELVRLDQLAPKEDYK